MGTRSVPMSPSLLPRRPFTPPKAAISSIPDGIPAACTRTTNPSVCDNGDGRKLQHAGAEQRIADLVEHLARPVASGDGGCLVQPFRLTARDQTEAQIAAATRQ